MVASRAPSQAPPSARLLHSPALKPDWTDDVWEDTKGKATLPPQRPAALGETREMKVEAVEGWSARPVSTPVLTP